MKTFFKEEIPRDKKYLRWIGTLPCLICKRPSIPHHQPKVGECNRPRCSDYRTLPICSAHHIDGGVPGFPGCYHGMGKITGWAFWERYGVDVELTIVSLNQRYNDETGARIGL